MFVVEHFKLGSGFQQDYRSICSVVKKDFTFKAKVKAKDWHVKDKAKELTLKYKAKVKA